MCKIVGLLKRRVYSQAEIAQLVEHMTENHGVASPILALGTRPERAPLTGCSLFPQPGRPSRPWADCTVRTNEVKGRPESDDAVPTEAFVARLPAAGDGDRLLDRFQATRGSDEQGLPARRA